jgi:competence/damage-inducible protein CinA-like protein
MQLELVTIGDELLLGFTIDTNAAHLARVLGDLGVQIVRRATCGDDPENIGAAVGDALNRTGAVITSGGLGPTADDQTKPAIARLFGREMRLDPDALDVLERRWKTLGRSGSMPESNRQQAMIPEGATVLHNNHGSAPGIWLEDAAGRWVAMVPGVPREMRGMLADTIVPRLRARLGERGTVIRSRTLRTTGIAESAVADRLSASPRTVAGLPLAYLPGADGVDLRLTARDLPADEADRRLAEGIAFLRDVVGRHAYAEGDTDLSAVILDLCRQKRLRLAVAESCTGGLLGARLTAIPGASDVFRGGIIAYDNAVKRDALGVSDAHLRASGAVSEAVVREMASGARTTMGADIGIAITGIAGPGGGTPDKPVGTVWLAVDTGSAARAYGGRFIGDREEIRRRASQAALDMVRQSLSE